MTSFSMMEGPKGTLFLAHDNHELCLEVKIIAVHRMEDVAKRHGGKFLANWEEGQVRINPNNTTNEDMRRFLGKKRVHDHWHIYRPAVREAILAEGFELKPYPKGNKNFSREYYKDLYITDCPITLGEYKLSDGRIIYSSGTTLQMKEPDE